MPKMKTTTLYVKNMVCDRCKAAVTRIFADAGISPLSVELGVVTVAEKPDYDTLDRLRTALKQQGFELLEDHRRQIVERIKNEIIEMVHYRDNLPSANISAYLADKLSTDYGTLSKMFSETTGTTIEKYFILQRVERVKELLFYSEMSISEIALKMNYSSVAYLSTQFKSVTGMTPSQFKAMKNKELKQLDKI